MNLAFSGNGSWPFLYSIGMMHKLRAVMWLRDDSCLLDFQVEPEEDLFSTAKKEASSEWGRGGEKRTFGMVMPESGEVKSAKKKGGRFKM